MIALILLFETHLAGMTQRFGFVGWFGRAWVHWVLLGRDRWLRQRLRGVNQWHSCICLSVVNLLDVVASLVPVVRISCLNGLTFQSNLSCGSFCGPRTCLCCRCRLPVRLSLLLLDRLLLLLVARLMLRLSFLFFLSHLLFIDELVPCLKNTYGELRCFNIVHLLMVDQNLRRQSLQYPDVFQGVVWTQSFMRVPAKTLLDKVSEVWVLITNDQA